MKDATRDVGPYVVKERCHCVRPVRIHGLDYLSGWGRSMCQQCKAHISWSVIGEYLG